MMTQDSKSLELARVVLQQGEVRLQAQLQMALAADQRALTLAGIFIGLATALFGAAAAVDPVSVRIGAAIAGGLLVVSAGLCIAASWPCRFAPPGSLPWNWWSDGVHLLPLDECLRTDSFWRGRDGRGSGCLRAGTSRGVFSSSSSLRWSLISTPRKSATSSRRRPS